MRRAVIIATLRAGRPALPRPGGPRRAPEPRLLSPVPAGARARRRARPGDCRSSSGATSTAGARCCVCSCPAGRRWRARARGPRAHPHSQIDHLLARGPWRVTGAGSRDGGSDHRALYADVELTDQAPALGRAPPRVITGSTTTRVLPRLAPEKSPLSAPGAFSSPSHEVLVVDELAAAHHRRQLLARLGVALGEVEDDEALDRTAPRDQHRRVEDAVGARRSRCTSRSTPHATTRPRIARLARAASRTAPPTLSK